MLSRCECGDEVRIVRVGGEKVTLNAEKDCTTGTVLIAEVGGEEVATRLEGWPLLQERAVWSNLYAEHACLL